MTSPRVSIVMPVRNAGPGLSVALESIRQQTFAAWELVAVDDGSTDGSRRRLEDAAHGDSRIRVTSQPPQGIAEALERACAAARAEVIARMDADDWMDRRRLEQQFEFLRQNSGVGVVSCRVSYGGDRAAQAGYAEHVNWINSLLTPEQISLRRFVESPVAHPSVMFRKELMQNYGGYRFGDFPEDYELWLRWLDAGVKFEKIAEPLLVWNDPPGRLSRNAPCYRAEAFYGLKCAYLARWLKREVHPSREVWVWGAGRITRGRFRNLEEQGIPIAGFIDIDPRKLGRLRDGRHVVGPANLPKKEDAFILAGVGSRGARDLIADQLTARGWEEGADFLLAA